MTRDRCSWRDQQGFTLVELVIAILIVGVLAVTAVPVYRSYSQDARTVEAKTVAGALWTALTSSAIAACGSETIVSAVFPRAGLDPAGTTTPPRWQIVAGATNRLSVDCRSGAYAVDGDLFTVGGIGTDVSTIRVKLSYAPGGSPPARLRCSLDGGAAWADC